MKIILWGGIIFFLGSIFLIISNWKDLEVDTNGAIVKMRIEHIPGNCIGSKKYYFATFSFKGSLYKKRVGGSFCSQHHVGEFIDIKYLEGRNTLLFPHETVKSNLLAFAALGILGLIFALAQLKKTRK